MVNVKQKIATEIDEIGEKILRCPERRCEGVLLPNPNKGDYPRAFFLFPDDDSLIQLAIVGMNPGRPQRGEKEGYRALAKQSEERLTYKQCKEGWRGYAKEIKYYTKPRDMFLKQLLKASGKSLNGILYTEVVFCEKLPYYCSIPRKTFELCTDCHL